MTTDTFVPDAPPVDPAEALSLLSSLMRRYQKHADHMAIILQSAEDQRAEITEWAETATAQDGDALAALTEQMRLLAEVVIRSDPTGRKTVTLPGGAEVCFRAGSTSIEVAKDCPVGTLPRTITRQPPQPVMEVNRIVVAHLITEGQIVVNDDGSLSLKGDDGERLPIPGVRLVKSPESFSVKPV